MSFTDDFLKELEKRKKKIDNINVDSPYSGGNRKTYSDDEEDDFSSTFLRELENRGISSDKDLAELALKSNAGFTSNFGSYLDFARENESLKEDDIAPVKEKRTWFQKGAFSDGYDFGDISKTILGTAQDVRENLYTGALGIVEKTIDAGAGILSTVGKVFGADGFANKMQGFAEKDLIDERGIAKKATYNTQSGISHMLIGKEEEDNSILGDKSDSLVQSGGQLAAQIALGKYVPWWVTSGATSFGGEFESASKEGASIYKAAGSGLISAGAEILTEKLTGGSGLGEKGLINVERFTKGVANKTVKRLLDYGIDVVGEGAEEVVSSIFSRLGSKLYKEESLSELLLSEEAFDEYLEGFIGGAVLGGGMNVGKVSSSAKNKTDYRTGLTANEEAVVNKEVEKRIAEEEKAKGEKLTNKEKAEIQDRVLKDLDKGGISIDTIEEALGGESYKSYQDTVKKEDSVIEEEKTLRDEFNTLNRMKKGDMTGEQTDRLEELRTKLSDLSTQIENTKKTSERDFLQKKYKNEVEEIARGSRLEESYNERYRRKQFFNEDTSKYKGKAKQTIENLINSKSVNNTNRTHEFAESMAKYSEDQDVVVEFTNNAQLKADKNNHKLLKNFTADGNTKVFDLEMKNIDDDYAPVVTVNGEVVDNFEVDYKNGTVAFAEAPNGDVSIEYRKVSLINGFRKGDKLVLNMDSPQAWTFTVGHEVTHVLEGTKEYDEFRKAIIQYAKDKGDYDGRYESRKNLYNDGTDIDGEITADLTGEYILNDVDFIQNLATNHQNVFQKIYNEIKHMLKLVTAGSKEARQLERAKHNFEKAYRASAEAKSHQKKKTDTQYSLTEDIENFDNSWYNDNEIKLPVAEQKRVQSEALTWHASKRNQLITQTLSNGITYRYVIDDDGIAHIYGKKTLDNIHDLGEDYGNTSRTQLDSITEELWAGQRDNSSDSRFSRDGREPRKDDTNDNNFVSREGRSNGTGYSKNRTNAYRKPKKRNWHFNEDGSTEVTYSDGTKEILDIAPTKEASSTDGVFFDGKNDIQHSLSDDGDFGYHAGDLGKAEGYWNMVSSNRGTGHFGTGTYFVGDEMEISGSTYGNRPHEKVDFSKYKMFKPIGENEGFELHSALKYINDNISLYPIARMTFDEVYDIKKKAEDAEYDLYFRDDATEAEKADAQRTLDSLKEQFESIGYDPDSWDSEKLYSELKEIRGDYRSAMLNLSGIFSYRQDNGRLTIDGAEARIDSILQGVYDEVSRIEDAYAARYEDSPSTRFMKAMGYEGIDVRGMKGLDNTKYGSVIYDLKGDDLARKKEIGTAKYSLSEDSEGRKLSDNQSAYFEGSKVVDENGNLKVVYHGSPVDFNTFSLKYLGTNGTNEGYGFYFTDKRQIAEGYSHGTEAQRHQGANGKLFEVYLDIKKPLSDTEVTMTRSEFRKFLTELNKQVDEDGEPLDVLSNYGDVAWEGLNNVINSVMEIEYDGSDSDVNMIHSIINGVGNMETVFKVLRKTTGYDGIIVNEAEWGGDQTIYVAFHPEQIKNVDNLNPTSNPDTRLSLTDEGDTYGRNGTSLRDLRVEEVAPVQEDNALVTKTAQDTFSDDYAPMTEEEAAMIENEALDSITDADAPPEVDTPYDVQRDTGTIEDKPLKKISEKASEYLGLNRNEKATLEGIVQNYSQNENLDRDYLFSQIRDNFSVREEIVPNEDVRQMKKDIKSMNLFVSDEVKSDFGKSKEDGYTKFLRSNFGKLRIVKDAANGIEVDSAYEELSSLYPSYFPEDIINPADRLRTIADVASMSSEDVFPIEVSEAEIQEVADMVYIGVSEYMNEARLNAAEASVAPHSDTDAPLIESDIETENKVLSIREMYDQKKQRYRDSLAALEAGKEKSLASFNEAIGKKLNEYNALRNKNTKRANTLLQQIENLRLRRDNVQGDYTNRIAKQQVRLENFESKDFSEFENKVLAVRRKDIHGKIIEEAKAQYEAQGLDLDEVLEKAKDLSTFSTVDNTPQRVMEKSLGYKAGQILSDITVNKVAQNETEGIKWLNGITDKKNGLIAQLVKQYGIKPGSKESAAAQMYAEGFYVDKNNDIIKYGDSELEKDFPDRRVRENIKALSKEQRIRQFYDETLDKINESRTRNAYPEIQKLDNYFLHFRAMEDTFSRLGLPFNPKDIKAKDLPTDLNGVTADLKPGQPYFASAKHREGKRTSFDLLGGLEKYATSAKNQIYHIDDIQTLRAIRNYIADTYGQAKGLSDLDALTEEEVQERIKEVYGAHLSTFAKFLNEEANVLAGKTALIDRGLEGIIGRRAMTFMDSVNRQVGSNMVGYNISSALTNLIAPVQAFAKTNKADFIKGFAQTVSNKIGGIFGKGDSFTDESPVVIRRKGADVYYRTAWQKLSDPGYALMGAVDNFSTELIARAKYNELTRKGMDSETAHVETDKWVSRLMGDRSLGQMPQLYNSKTLGLVTKFQLEVRNQLDSQFYDTIQEAKASTEDIENGLERNAKKAAKITSTFFTLAIGQHLFGKAFESIAGYNPAFDIISALIKTLGLDDEEESEDTFLDNIEQGFFELMGDMPYTSILEGGRIPISSALPIEELYKGKDQYGNEKSRWETVLEALPYYTMPGGYGQLKKTTQGLGMFDDELPISGSYTDSGKLRFPVEDNFLNRVQAGIFGQYASENARDYFDNERKALDEKQIQEFIDSGISIQDYWNYREGLSGLKTLNEKADYINSLDLPIEVKNLLINNLSGRKDPIDLSGMEGYTDFNEYDFAQKNPEKYEWLKNNGITVEQYEGFDKETKEEYDFAYKSPEKYVVAKSVGGYSSYKTYTSDLYDIKADKDSDGKTISGSRKEKVIDYINNLDADYGEKIILFKSEYPADDTYNYEIIDYLNSRDDISYEEMNTILKELGFTIQPDGVTITWD
jgi:hypothetical protein